VTTRGLREAEVERLAHWVADICGDVRAQAVVDRVRADVLEVCARFPVYASESRRDAAPTGTGRDAAPTGDAPEAGSKESRRDAAPTG
jgi:hypothetical protein